MRIVFLVVASLLILGPFRRPFFRNWRFTIGATVMGLIAWFVTSASVTQADPGWMPWGVAFCVAMGAGAAAKEWLDGVFGKGD